jgi:hypothetical protein
VAEIFLALSTWSWALTGAGGASTLATRRPLSPAIKSLRVAVLALPILQIFNLLFSFPLLEDLAVAVHDEMLADDGDGSGWDHIPTVAQSSTPLMFTGTLELCLRGGIKPITRRLLSLPGGIHFRKFACRWFHEEDLSVVMALVKRCYHTLESLDITYNLPGKFVQYPRPYRHLLLFLDHSRPALIDLSKAIKLKDVAFHPDPWGIEWVVTALQTITPKHRDLRQISIHIPYRLTIAYDGGSATQSIGDPVYEQWLGLDRLLVQLWESHSIRPRIVPMMKEDLRDCAGCLLPEITKRGIIDLVKQCTSFGRHDRRGKQGTT